MLTRSMFTNIFKWVDGYRRYNRWTKYDTNMLNSLYILRKELNKKQYQYYKHKKRVKIPIRIIN